LTITTDQIEKLVKDAISDKLQIDLSQVRKHMHLQKDLGADSLAMYELIMAFEEKFDINISDKDFEGVFTVKDSIERIERLIT
jgi:acyl carrier protein